MIFALIACTSGDLSPYLPTVTFQRLDLTSLDFESINVDFVFDVANPNPVDIPLSRFDYALGFEGIDLISGSDPEGLELVAEGTSELALPVGLVFANIFDIAAATRGLDFIGFGLRGGFGFDTDLGPVDIAYDEEGSFPALRTPTFDLGQLRIESADTESVQFGLDMNVDNDHGSTLDFSNLNFEIDFAGINVGGGSMDTVASVPGASSETVTLPFGLDFADAIAALEAVANGDAIRVDLNADVDVDTPFGLVPLTFDEQGNVDVQDESAR